MKFFFLNLINTEFLNIIEFFVFFLYFEKLLI